MATLLKNGRWTATFDPGGPNQRVLVELGDLMESDLDFAAEQQTARGDYLDDDATTPLGRGNVARVTTMVVVKKHADLATAWQHCFETDLAVPVNVHAPLQIQIIGGNTYRLANAVFKSWKTIPRRGTPFATTSTYTLECGALTRI